MAPSQPDNFTTLLVSSSNGDRDALDRLVPLVYHELHRMAERYLRRERPDHTLQPTALVHEAYMRLVDQNVAWQNRVGTATVIRQWRLAKAWLYHEVSREKHLP